MSEKKKVNLYNKLYEINKDYNRNLKPMYRIIKSSINFNINSFLDYGCGKSNLTEIFSQNNNIQTYKYDPAIKEFSNLKNGLKVDLVANCDVMEHIPEDEIDGVLMDISKISNNVFFNIYLEKAETILPNGENAHCTVKPIQWWQNKILKYFSEANIVLSSYKNSVCIITWKISFLNKVLNFFVFIFNLFEHLIYRIRILKNYLLSRF